MPRPRVVCLTTGAFAQNGYLVGDAERRTAVVVDPGEDADLFLRRLRTEGWTLTAVWLTHAHVDHVAGVARVKSETGVPVFLHPEDRPLYDGAAEQGRSLGYRIEPPPPPEDDLADGQRLAVGDVQFEVRHIPGHSPGSVAFVSYGVALVGDALFAGSIGRTDLPGGDMTTLLTSIRTRLFTLPGETLVYPGHGPETTIERERTTNPFLAATCLRCGHPVAPKPWGCKNPCPTCRFPYPLGDCSD